MVEYRRFWQDLTGQLSEPDQILLLEAPPDELLNRIRRRGRPFEQSICKGYLEQLATGLREMYRDASEGSVQRFDSTNLSELVRVVPATMVSQLGCSEDWQWQT